MSDPSIELRGVGKRYVKYDDEPMLVTRALRFTQRTRRSTLWAVRGVDLEVRHGESLGVIGRNGSGKSTLLQMLAGVTAPTEGSVTVRGRIAPLVSVGVGFHPELTGRENVYVNGAILGMTREEIDERFDDIVAFSGIAAFIDTPVKFYSSGMYVRLGFSVAVEARPDVLLVDEVLAVGDVGFQVRCFKRMQEIREKGTTVVVVSHNLNAIRQLCDRALVLHDGRPRMTGDVEDGIALYHELLGEWQDPEAPQTGQRRVENGVAEIVDLQLIDDAGRPTTRIETGDRVTLEAAVRFDRPVARPMLGIGLLSAAGSNVYSETSARTDYPPAAAGETRTFRASLQLPLGVGSYTLHVGVHRRDSDDFDMTQLHERRLPFWVSGRTGYSGVVDLGAQFVAPAATGEGSTRTGSR